MSRIVFLGLSITSSWGNGHATTYRGLVRALAARGHEVTFLERDVPWYADHRDMARPAYGRTCLYRDLTELGAAHGGAIAAADAVIVGSYVPEGVAVGGWVQETARGLVAFYDIDTPVTLAKLATADWEYLSPSLISGYDLYLSFTGGPTLRRLEQHYGAPMARALYCSVDPEIYRPEPAEASWDLGYIGTHSSDRQPKVERLLLEPARLLPEQRFVLAGPQYPADMRLSPNLDHIDHLAPDRHRAFYTRQRFTLNLTRAEMVTAGWSPSVRLFEAAACGVPIISDPWAGLDTLFVPGQEILIADEPEDITRILTRIGETERRALGDAGRRRILVAHTADHRARELEVALAEAAELKERRLASYRRPKRARARAGA